MSLDKIRKIFSEKGFDNWVKSLLSQFEPNQAELKKYINELKASGQFEKYYDKEPDYKPTTYRFIMFIASPHDVRKTKLYINPFNKDDKAGNVIVPLLEHKSFLTLDVTGVFQKIASL